MSFIDKYLIKLLSKQIGEDQFGNEYFISKIKNYLGHNKRYVIYNGIEESSKVLPMWHAWLHYLSDDIPGSDNQQQNYVWQKSRVLTLTGTQFAYNPEKSNYKTLKVYEK